MASRIGVDIGGTFTDFICYDEDGNKVIIDKIPTTPSTPEKAVIEVIKRNFSESQLNKVDFFLHGTTVGLNALLERKGSKVGLICTKGFRDILEIRRGDRDQMYNLFWQPAPPLVPRYLRLEVEERIMANGNIHKQINKEQLKEVCQKLINEKVSSIAIALINSYTNNVHEAFIEKTLRDLGFDGQISLSYKVSGEYREYERTTTTVIDAFVKSRMSNYLNTLKKELNAIGFKGGFLVTRSGSGSMTFDEAEDRPFETIMSGPVAGAEGAGELSRKLNNTNMVTADVGGTSFDTCLILNGRPQIQYEGTIVGLPVQSPWVDVRSIGAGGGSLAYLDEGGLLRSGPQSSGADPGPACYNRGGSEPTTTDAAFYLGMLGEGKLASGLELNKSLSEEALNSVAPYKMRQLCPSRHVNDEYILSFSLAALGKFEKIDALQVVRVVGHQNHIKITYNEELNISVKYMFKKLNFLINKTNKHQKLIKKNEDNFLENFKNMVIKKEKKQNYIFFTKNFLKMIKFYNFIKMIKKFFTNNRLNNYKKKYKSQLKIFHRVHNL